MIPYSQFNAIANRIIHLLNNCISQSHIHQIQAQIILHKLHFNTTIALDFITACQYHNLSLLHSSLPLFFTHHTKPHVFTCNTLIKAFSHSQCPDIPSSIYIYMNNNSIPPNNYTFPFLLKSLSDFKDFNQGQCVHTHVIKLGQLNDIYVQNSLLNVYASCGRVALCRKLFDEMPERDVVSWTVLIMGYRDALNYADALIAFEQMQYEGVVPNRVTIVNVLGACASLGAIEMGVWIHDFIRKNGWELDVILGTSLIDMYVKCGRIHEGLNVFKSMKEKNIFTWNSVINGLAFAKCGKEAVLFFKRMEQEGVNLDEVTLVNVLSACSHSGLVDTGQHIFSSLVVGKYGFSPNAKHYACMVDLFARAGHLDYAFKIIKEIPFEPTKSMWGSLLTGCRVHRNLELSEFAARKLVELEPGNSAHYVVLSNLYSEMGRWSDAAEIRELMKEKGLKKDSGSSSVESNLKDTIMIC
ncbi:hypothetical protein JCGZ_13896 [Jatropha curcas]|uniref:Uncharacterized protein n=1 Tax=Jatropha curcas TaxID=180498 RepID=A0A067K793_JATCU|nr:pentatricopeptide repeat-containing protein At5g66520 [Jatropha curcas]KDP28125.1 hypothetical protein JCGZ_13896 [Jatropha curcas]